MNAIDHMPAASWQDRLVDATDVRMSIWVAAALTFALVVGMAVFA